MVLITGKYLHERNENIDEYFKSLGVPYLARKMMAVSHPTLEISNEGDKWTMKNVTLISTQEVTFCLGEEYEEVLPSGDKLRSITTLDGNTLVTISRYEEGNKITRRYDFDEAGITLTMSHERSNQIGKRFYKRSL
ncbi:fatty acid-binding protein, liver-like [Venturia canescens]|uniref:fatty acid-binding protein, liver-like n=1 Tax=Venturia canescens TaxID=32260 RepID=UPI001C9C906F|nr:fatty acid-binding protein, liver-like [Venturia canescens]